MCYYYLMLKFRGFHIEAIEHSYRALEVCRKLQLGKNARRFENDSDVSPVTTRH